MRSHRLWRDFQSTGLEGIEDLGLVALIVQRGIFRQPYHVARLCLDRPFVLAADAQAESTFEHDDQFVIKHRPLDGAAVEGCDARTHARRHVRSDKPRYLCLARRSAIGFEPHVVCAEMLDLGHCNLAFCFGQILAPLNAAHRGHRGPGNTG